MFWCFDYNSNPDNATNDNDHSLNNFMAKRHKIENRYSTTHAKSKINVSQPLSFTSFKQFPNLASVQRLYFQPVRQTDNFVDVFRQLNN